MHNIAICLYGAASSNIADNYLHKTEELGCEIGARGHSLVFGGGSTGLMGACARGVKSAGGHLIAVIPKFMGKFELLMEDCNELIWTETMSQRKEIMEERANAFIIAPGGIGTMDEFFEILTLKSLDLKSCPILLYNIDGYFDDIIHFIDTGIQKGFIRTHVKDCFRAVNDPTEALDLIEYFS